MNKTLFSRLKPIFVGIFLISLWVIIGFGPDYLTSQQGRKPLHIHQAIVDNSLQFDWVANNLIVHTGKQTTNLLVSNNKLYLYGALNSESFDLWQVNKDNGQFIRNITPTRWVLPTSFSRLDSLAYDPKYIYISYSGGKTIKGSSLGAGGFAIYDSVDEKVIWSQRVPSINNVESFVAGELFVVMDNGFGEYYIIDVSNRAISLPIEKEDYIIAYEQGRTVYNQDVAIWYTRLDPQNKQNHDVAFWQEIFDNVQLTPIILDDWLVVRTRASSMIGEAKLIDRANGQTIFTNPIPVMSNIAVNGHFAYYLALPNQLIQWDLMTGESKAIAEFDGGNFRLTQERGYYMATDDSRLYVYLGDSRQLFAFQFTPPAAGQ